MTFVVPTGKTLPAGTPLRVMTTQLLQLSVAVACPSCASVTTALHDGPAATVTFAGAVTTGAVVSDAPAVRSTLVNAVFMFGTIRSAAPSQLRSTAAMAFGCQCELRQVGP